VRALRFTAACSLAAAIAASAYTAEEKTDIPAWGPAKLLLEKADPTNAGTFDGTWIYVNRDSRYALWARTKNGVPQIKIQYQSLANPEAFETDWDGKAVYYLAGTPVNFDLTLGKRDANRIAGTWSWVLKVENSARNETADLAIYRTGYGRTLLMDFQNYKRTIMRSGKEQTFHVPMAWTWTKISQRELLWDELPF
jgi:hypothetical protein